MNGTTALHVILVSNNRLEELKLELTNKGFLEFKIDQNSKLLKKDSSMVMLELPKENLVDIIKIMKRIQLKYQNPN